MFAREIRLVNSDRKRIAVVTISYKDGKLSITGRIGDLGRVSDSYGQIGGTLWEEFKSPSVQLLCAYWEAYHLNDMQAGLPIQTDCLNANAESYKLDYDGRCELLKRAGLYEVNGEKYGHKWHTIPVPPYVLEWLEKGKIEA
mgnify:CR=1 FL=1